MLLALAPADDGELGRKLFESQCALCHGQTGGGGRGPALTRAKLDKAADEATLHKVIGEGLPPEMPGAWQLSPREVAAVGAFVRSLGAVPVQPLPGDANRGAEIYRARGCRNCHIVNGDGTPMGPELTAIASRRNAAHLREAIVNPSATLPDDFLLIEAKTPSQTIRGMRVNEDSFTIQIRDVQGRFHSLRKADLRQFEKLKGQSPMPAYKLPGDDLDHLVAYLASLRGKP